MVKFSIVKNFFLWIVLSLIVIAWWVYAFLTNLNLSIEFTWWLKLVIVQVLAVDKLKTEIQQEFKWKNLKIEVSNAENATDILIRQATSVNKKTINSVEVVDSVKEFLKSKNYIKSPDDVLSISNIGPTIWEYMKNAAKRSIIWGLILMAIYILVAFVWVRLYFSPWIFSLVTIVTLLHDIVISAWWYGLMMWLDPMIMVDSVFVMAILTILWYSINDTIIIFDRIRENIIKNDENIKKWKKTLVDIFDISLYQTIRRSIWTSISTFVVVLAMWYFGSEVLRNFAFVIMIGIIAWTYSSIFIAAPMAYRTNMLVPKAKL